MVLTGIWRTMQAECRQETADAAGAVSSSERRRWKHESGTRRRRTSGSGRRLPWRSTRRCRRSVPGQKHWAGTRTSSAGTPTSSRRSSTQTAAALVPSRNRRESGWRTRRPCTMATLIHGLHTRLEAMQPVQSTSPDTFSRTRQERYTGTSAVYCLYTNINTTYRMVQKNTGYLNKYNNDVQNNTVQRMILQIWKVTDWDRKKIHRHTSTYTHTWHTHHFNGHLPVSFPHSYSSLATCPYHENSPAQAESLCIPRNTIPPKFPHSTWDMETTFPLVFTWFFFVLILSFSMHLVVTKMYNIASLKQSTRQWF